MFFLTFHFLLSWLRLKRRNKAAEHREIKAQTVGWLRRVRLSRLSFEQSPGEVSRLLNASWKSPKCNRWVAFCVSCRNSQKSFDERNVIWHLVCLKFNGFSCYNTKRHFLVFLWWQKKAGFSNTKYFGSKFFLFSLSIKTTVVHHRSRINILDLYQVIKQQVS